jgi:phosphate transport system permease protein
MKLRVKSVWDGFFYSATLIAALAAVIFLLGIIISLFYEGAGIFMEVGFAKFVFGTAWFPTYDPPEFGIFPLIYGSAMVTLIALLFSVPLGLGVAIYISEIAGPKQKEFLKPFVELLAGIPSVIYGLFGMAFLAPFLQKLLGLPTGLNAFTAGIILGIMVIPIISSIAEDAINSVPRTLREASYSLGANTWETITKVVVPSARSGIIAGIILGFGRAVGETMVVLMVSGNSALIATSVFQPVRPMPSAIAAEMAETAFGSSHFQALFGIAIVLFILTFITNIITEFVKSKYKKNLS